MQRIQKERDLLPQFETNWLICMGDFYTRLKEIEQERGTQTLISFKIIFFLSSLR